MEPRDPEEGPETTSHDDAAAPAPAPQAAKVRGRVWPHGSLRHGTDEMSKLFAPGECLELSAAEAAKLGEVFIPDES